ncbi:MAG TPA: hypothetical protein VLC52_02325 [Anaerolineae bacterium]|nr:hypothetical protein [Anaerolineae bacterium]
MESLWQILLRATASKEPLSCDDCFVFLDYLSELLAEGMDPRAILPIAQKVMQRCPSCQEEYQHDMIELLAAPSTTDGAILRAPPAAAH